MPIKWSALKVTEAADKIEEFIKEAAEPLEQARIVAREALKLPNLPQYIEWDINRIIGEIDRAIGAASWNPSVESGRASRVSAKTCPKARWKKNATAPGTEPRRR